MPADTRSSLIYLAALISGAAALIYQVSWIGMLSMTFGSTTLASAAVIGAFMLSMGLGARAYDRISRRFTNPFRFYGLLEVGIAATAAGVSSLIHALPGVYAALAGGPEAVSGNAFLRLALAFILLLVPCLLMGATFPALCRAAIASRSALNRHLGPIYGLNTLGAALGALLAGLILIELVGRQASIWIAGLGNLAAAAIAWALAQQSGVRHDTTAVAASADSDRRTPSVPLSVITVTLFVS
ncbi:MAG TPA: hypothetical protein VLB27_04165, partial [candidate division Zixibacteria bacterium]|nr:hypothetical protein [candidate division Zixibacteria bacterium]